MHFQPVQLATVPENLTALLEPVRTVRGSRNECARVRRAAVPHGGDALAGFFQDLESRALGTDTPWRQKGAPHVLTRAGSEIHTSAGDRDPIRNPGRSVTSHPSGCCESEQITE